MSDHLSSNPKLPENMRDAVKVLERGRALLRKGLRIRLKPCPFCGTQAKLRKTWNAEDWWIVGCQSLRCEVRPEIQHTDVLYAVGRWQKRFT